MFKFAATAHSYLLNKSLSLACAVCQFDIEVPENSTTATKCAKEHIVHDECIEPWVKDHTDCPVCREHLPRRKNGDINRVFLVDLQYIVTLVSASNRGANLTRY